MIDKFIVCWGLEAPKSPLGHHAFSLIASQRHRAEIPAGSLNSPQSIGCRLPLLYTQLILNQDCMQSRLVVVNFFL